jgi:DNA-directed RNA polymerase subunit L
MQAKVQIVPGSSSTSATFVVNGEDHTLGNALRYMLMRDRSTLFCGYSMPHPSEATVNIRLQTSAPPPSSSSLSSSSSEPDCGATAPEVFRRGLRGLICVAEAIGAQFDAALGEPLVLDDALPTPPPSASATAVAVAGPAPPTAPAPPAAAASTKRGARGKR